MYKLVIQQYSQKYLHDRIVIFVFTGKFSYKLELLILSSRTSRKDWMTTENRTVTLERQMTTRNRLDRGTRGSIPNCSPRERAPITKLQTPQMKDTPRVFREGGRMIDSHGRISWNRHGLPNRLRIEMDRSPVTAERCARTNAVLPSTKGSLVANV